MMLALIIITLLYTCLIAALWVGFNKVESFDTTESDIKIGFSIIIPFRNEAHHLPQLLKTIANLNYPNHLFEVWLVNDHSKDDFVQVIESFQQYYQNIQIKVLNCVKTTKSPKKEALNLGILHSKFDWVLTTDADCELSPNLLVTYNAFINKNNPVMVCAPVGMKIENSFLNHYQLFNFLSLIGSSIGAFGIGHPIMCNGANLCFNKKAFFKVNGYQGNLHIASGDDVFLLEKMLQSYPKKVHFLKSADTIVKTTPENSWSTFINQQLRWASKTGSYNNYKTKLIGILVFSENLMLVYASFYSLFYPMLFPAFAIAFVLKLVFDVILITKTSAFLKSNSNLWHYFPTAVLYPFITTSIGIVSLFKKYTWKHRSFIS